MLAKTVWQRIPGRRTRNSKTYAPTTKTVQTIARNDQLPLTGRPQMLTTSNFGCWCAAVHQLQLSRSMKTSIHQHSELKLYRYSVSDVEPVKTHRPLLYRRHIGRAVGCMQLLQHDRLHSTHNWTTLLARQQVLTI